MNITLKSNRKVLIALLSAKYHFQAKSLTKYSTQQLEAKLRRQKLLYGKSAHDYAKWLELSSR